MLLVFGIEVVVGADVVVVGLGVLVVLVAAGVEEVVGAA